MYKSSEKFSTAIEKNGGRTFHPKLIFDGFELETEIHSLNYNGGSNGEDNITIGSAVSATLEIKMDKVPHLLTKQNFSFNLGILCEDGSYEFIPMGKFNAEKPETTDYEINVTAYDNMVLAERTYNSQLTYPTTTTAVIKEICNAIGVSFATEIESITINNPSSEEGASNSAFAGYTMREAIGYIAGLYGEFAIFNRLGQLEFRWYEDSNYDVKLSKTYSFTKDEQDYSIDQLIVLQNQETTFKAGSGVNGISCSNPFATQSIVDAIYQKIGGFTFRKGSVKFLGDCRIDPWDIVTVEDLLGNTYKLPVMSISHSVDGGLTTNIESFSNDNDDVSDSFSGPVTKAMERTYAQLLVVNKLIADRVTADYVEANYVKTKEIDAIQANIETAVITNLQGKFATIEYLSANYATIQNLNVAIGRISTLETNSLTANSAVITTLKSSVADINTLLFGNASGGSLSTEFSNSVVSLIGNAQIKSAMIESLDASKITALDLNTTKFKVHSENGMSYWQDNTIVIKDTKRVRVQIGKDANSDYNMYVWDKSGNLMFDAVGLTEKGINRPVIRNDMVKEDANISASKLDISSLFNVINNDGSHTLKSSKIYIDANKQTLDVAFKNMTTNVTDLQKSVTTQGTQLTTVQGQISSKVWQQDITTAVNGLQIGGRNLYKGTKYWNGEWIVKDGVTIAEDVAKMTAVAYPYYGTVAVKSKEQYTISLDVKSDVAHTTTEGGVVLLNFVDSKKQRVHTIWVPGSFATEWKRINYTFNVPENKNIAALWIGLRNNSNKVVYFKYLKLEKGNKATDWTPAPEDIDSSISTVDGKVTTISNQYTSLNQSLTSLTATVNSNTTKINSKADGSTVTALQSNMTALTADLNGFKTTVSSTYSTKTELNNLQIGGRNLLQGTKDFSKGTRPVSGIFDLSNTVGTYKVLKAMCPSDRAYYDPFLQSITFEAKTTYTLSFYAKADSPYTILSYFYDIGNTGSYYDGLTRTTLTTSWKRYVITWTTGDTSRTATVIPMRLSIKNVWAYMYGIKFEKGNKATDWTPAPEDVDSSIESVATIANQTANKFQWIVKSGTSATDFTLTDRVASLLSAKFDIDALTTFKNSASNGTSTVINGGAIKANTITADKIKVDSLQAISAKIGGFTIGDNNIASGTWGTSGSVMMCTGTDGAKPIGGSGTISGWCFTAGNAFGVTKAGALYTSDVTVTGGKIDLNASSVSDVHSAKTAYFRAKYSDKKYIRLASGGNGSTIDIIDGKTRFYASASDSNATIQVYDKGGSSVFQFDSDTKYLFVPNVSASGSILGGTITSRGNLSAEGTLSAKGTLELATSGNASNIILHDDYAKYCYIRYSGARLWFLPSTDSGGFELGNSASLDANTGTFYATAWGSNSSRRYKENITELTESVADRLLKIKTYHFDYKKDYGNKDMYGVIAEEVEQVHKNAVLYRNGEPDAVDYTRFIPLLIKKVQMQDKKIKNLDNMVTHLIGIAMNHS